MQVSVLRWPLHDASKRCNKLRTWDLKQRLYICIISLSCYPCREWLHAFIPLKLSLWKIEEKLVYLDGELDLNLICKLCIHIMWKGSKVRMDINRSRYSWVSWIMRSCRFTNSHAVTRYTVWINLAASINRYYLVHDPVQHKPEVVNRKKKTVYIKQVIKIYIVIFFMFENVMWSPRYDNYLHLLTSIRISKTKCKTSMRPPHLIATEIWHGIDLLKNRIVLGLDPLRYNLQIKLIFLYSSQVSEVSTLFIDQKCSPSKIMLKFFFGVPEIFFCYF